MNYQANYQVEEFYFNGRRGCLAHCEAVVYPGEKITATVDNDKATENQFRKALKVQFPDHDWVITGIGTNADGYMLADGRKEE